MTIDLDLVRRDTPGVGHVAHLNNAGGALRPQVVTDTVVAHLRREAEIGPYEAETEATERIESVYDSVATLVHAHRDEIALVQSATVAWDVAFASIPLKAGQRILTARTEYVSNAIALLQACERSGARLQVIEDDEHGQIDLDAFENALDHDVALVALTHVPTGGGVVNPAAEVGALVRQTDAVYLLDACQSVGQLDVDVTAIGCDLLAATGRKFLRGPRGTGFLYASRDVTERLVPPVLGLGAAVWTSSTTYAPVPTALRFETWERSIADILGLGAAVDYALSVGMPAIEERVTTLAARLRVGPGDDPGRHGPRQGRSALGDRHVHGRRPGRRRGPRRRRPRRCERERHPGVVGSARLRRARPDRGRPRVTALLHERRRARPPADRGARSVATEHGRQVEVPLRADAGQSALLDGRDVLRDQRLGAVDVPGGHELDETLVLGD